MNAAAVGISSSSCLFYSRREILTANLMDSDWLKNMGHMGSSFELDEFWNVSAAA
jgi:hypothetical protein